VCQGARFNPATLEIRHRDRSIAEVLAMSIDEAVEFFEFDARIQRPLKLLKRCGLGYLTLGQSSPTLSGGEAQRLKLVTELIRGRGGSENPGLRRRSSSNLYILEEPSIGLHFSDVQKLIEIIHELVDQGHSVVVIEHNLDLIAEADHVIDLGPEGGDAGGRIVAEGTPEDIASHKHSRTGRFLARILQPVSKTPSRRRKSLVAA
jgi:excinuclease ABC subunit A